ncbi:hypothetical protein VH567_15610 [Sphingomonas sp. 4RDLI-65]|uniref:hypothetical protein n=1 Tax=Sphingomonas sp. 4RDLI-65 TaxID=3111641 RepID=UPI003C1D225D
MKTIVLLGATVIAGAVRYPSEGPIPVRDDAEADRLVEMKLAEHADEATDGDGLDDIKVEDLKKLATEEKVDLGDAKNKPDIIKAIRAHRAAPAA